MNRKSLRQCLVCVALPLALIPRVAAQEKPAPSAATPQSEAKEEVVELSPFVVTSDEDEGYAANYTLAGTRIRTDIKDVGSSITVVTAKMLADTGTTNAAQLLVYTPNTEVNAPGGNFLGNGDDAYAGQVRYGSNRVRGLSNADNTRDFFLTEIPWDSYNTGRIDIQRGPNSILFGIGSPAGIINASLNHAGFKNSYKVENKLDNFGTVRFSGDFNQVLIDNQLAIRVSLLDDDTKYKQAPAFRHDQRLFAALRYDPAFLNRGNMVTSFEASYERGDIEQNLPRQAPPTDYVTPWFLLPAGYRASGITARSGVNFDSSPAGLWISGAGDQLTTGGTIMQYDQQDYSGIAFPHNVSGQDTWLGNSFYRGITSYGSAINTKRKVATAAFGPAVLGANIDSWKATVIKDRSFFDSYNNLLDGDTKRENLDFSAFNAAFRQSFFDDTFGYELAFDMQRTHPNGYSYLGTAGYGIVVDVMGTYSGGGIIGGSPNPAGGTFAEVADPLNRNLGKPFVIGARGSSFNWAHNEKMVGRFTGYYNLDFKKLLGRESRIAQALNKNTFTVLASRYTNDIFSGSGSPYMMGESGRVLLGDTIYNLHYLSQAKLTGTSGAGANLPTLAGLPGDISGVRPRFNTTTKLWEQVPFTIVNQLERDEDQRVYSSSSKKEKDYFDSFAGVWQGYWFGGNIIPMIGYRRDESWAQQGGIYDAAGKFTQGAPQTVFSDPAGGNSRTLYNPFATNYVFGPDSVKTRVNSRTYSIVTHTPKWVRAKLPGDIDVQLIYNQSENFQPAPGRTDIMNRRLADPSGETKEYGVAVSALNDKLYLKVVHYETKQKDVEIGKFFNDNIGSIAAQEVWARSAAYVHAGIHGPEGTGTEAVGPNSGNFQANRIYGISSDGHKVTFKPYGPWATNIYDGGGASGSTVWDGRSNGYKIWGGGSEPYAAGTVRTAYTQAEIDATWAIEDAAIKAVLNNPPPDDFITANGINRSTFFGAKGPGMFDYGNGAATAAVTGDTISEGTEFELVGNPIKGLTVQLNASRTSAKRTSIAKSFLDYIDSRRPFFYGPAGDMRIWDAGWADTQVDPYNNSGNGNMSVAFRAQVDSPISKFLAATDTNVPELHPWAFNGIANYQFQDGFLKAFHVGAGYRWQDKLVTGYPVTHDAFGNETYDLEHPFYGKSQSAIDGWVGYSRNLSRRIKWHMQVNVRNIFADKSLILSSVQPDGSPAAYRIPEPRTVTLTNTFEF